MVADLSDDDIDPGGITEWGSPAASSIPMQGPIKAFINGEKVHWWFSDRAIQEHKKATPNSLNPNKPGLLNAGRVSRRKVGIPILSVYNS